MGRFNVVYDQKANVYENCWVDLTLEVSMHAMSMACVSHPKGLLLNFFCWDWLKNHDYIYVQLAIGWLLVSHLHFWLVDVKRNIRCPCCCSEFYFKWLGGETCHHQVI